MKSSIRVLALDFGNVLGTFNHMKACQRLSEMSSYCAEEIHERYFGNECEDGRLKGHLDEHSFFADVRRDLHLPKKLSLQDFAEIWGDIFTPAPRAMHQLLASMSYGVRFCLVSNTEVLHWQYIKNMPTVAVFFPPEHQALSFMLGARKPDRLYYERVLTLMNVSPRNVLYIDDVPSYGDMFRSMGATAERFDLNTDTVDDFAGILEQYNLLRF